MKVSSVMLALNIQADLSFHLDRGPFGSWKSVAAEALVCSLTKKLVDDEHPTANAKALELFLQVNEELPQEPHPIDMLDEYLLGQLREELYRFWYIDNINTAVDDIHQVFCEGRCGPGKSLGAKFDDFYSKLFSTKLTATNRQLYNNYRESCSQFPLWDEAEKLRSVSLGECDTIGYNKLNFVPKRNDISRTICTEPSLNMYYQLGLGKLLESRLFDVYKINFTSQPDFNREMAFEGSIDGKYATIDLSSASDSLSIGVLKAILPKPFFSWLERFRSSHTLLPDGREVQLNMISTMGNGFTFPLETIIFTAIVAAAYALHGVPLQRNKRGKHGNFGVFGDDIIVLKDIAPKVFRLLKLLGFRVNADKTFVEGLFRESCGGDFFAGHNVRGVYIKRLTSPQDRYVAINLLNDWSASTGISLRKTTQYLLETVRWIFIPPLCGLDEGIHVPLSMAKPSYDMNGSFLFRSYKARPRHTKVKDNGDVAGRPLINPAGLEAAFFAGYIRSHKIGYRQKSIFYGLKEVISPVWDEISLVRSYRRFSFTQWQTAAYYNMYK